jgi:hypothetical protein
MSQDTTHVAWHGIAVNLKTTDFQYDVKWIVIKVQVLCTSLLPPPQVFRADSTQHSFYAILKMEAESPYKCKHSIYQGGSRTSLENLIFNKAVRTSDPATVCSFLP